MIIRTQSLIDYLEHMGLMPTGDPYEKNGTICLFYKNYNNNFGHPIIVSNEFYDVYTVKSICNKFAIPFDEELIKNM